MTIGSCLHSVLLQIVDWQREWNVVKNRCPAPLFASLRNADTPEAESEAAGARVNAKLKREYLTEAEVEQLITRLLAIATMLGPLLGAPTLTAG